MTLTTTINRKDYTGNGATLVFAYTFLITANADLGVYLDGVKKTLTTDYTVSGAGAPTGGNVTFVVAPGSGVAVSILREVAYTQSVDYVENQKFPAETHEGALDRLTALCQQLLEKIGRAATFKVQSILTNPVMADGVVGKILRWKTTTELENIDLVGTGVISTPVSAAQGGTGADLSAGGAVGDLLVGGTPTTFKRKGAGADGKFLRTIASQSDGLAWDDSPTKQSFAELHVRTHPDNDKASNQVAILGLKRLTMDDGTLYEDVVVPGTDAPVAIDITVAGANGLDTGSRVASTGYELWAVGKSSTKAKADLRYVLHRAKDYFKDQSFETADDAVRILRLATGTATDLLAQGFQLATAGKVEIVDIKESYGGTPGAGNVWLEIRTDNAGNPSTTVLATSDKMDAVKMAGSIKYVRFVFRNPATLSAATQYHLVMNADYARSDVNVLAWRGVAAGGYANGAAKEYNGTTWANASGVGDFTFKLYVIRNDAAVTMPAGYDQKCLLAPWFFNNSGNAFAAIEFYDKRALPLAANNLGSVTSTSPLLTDASAVIPPRRTRVIFGVLNTTASVYNSVAGIPDGFGAIVTAKRSGGAGSFVTTIAGALGSGSWGITPGVATEYQAVYLFVGTAATTGEFNLEEWEW